MKSKSNKSSGQNEVLTQMNPHKFAHGKQESRPNTRQKSMWWTVTRTMTPLFAYVKSLNSPRPRRLDNKFYLDIYITACSR